MNRSPSGTAGSTGGTACTHSQEWRPYWSTVRVILELTGWDLDRGRGFSHRVVGLTVPHFRTGRTSVSCVGGRRSSTGHTGKGRESSWEGPGPKSPPDLACAKGKNSEEKGIRRTPREEPVGSGTVPKGCAQVLFCGPGRGGEWDTGVFR